MAEAKKKPGRPPGSKNKNTSGESKASSSTGTKSKAKEKVEQIQAKKKADRRVMDEIWAIIAIAIGVFLVVAIFFGGAGEFGTALGNVLKGILGHIAYLFPFYIILYGILLFAKKTVHISVKSIVLVFTLLTMFTIMNSARFIQADDLQFSWDVIKNYYADGVVLKNGGFIGMVLASLLIKWFGKAGCWIFAVVMVLISGILLINTPVSRLISKMFEKMEERKLLKEHAHLDYVSEDEQGIQIAMSGLDSKPAKKSIFAKKATVMNSSVLDEKKNEASTVTPVASDASDAQVKPAKPVSRPAVIVGGMNVSMDDEPAVEETVVEEPEYIPPSKQVPINENGKSSVLKYMNDDSLFGRSKSGGGSVGLEDKVDYGEGFGLDGRVSRPSGKVGLDSDGASDGVQLGFGIPASSEKVQRVQKAEQIVQPVVRPVVEPVARPAVQSGMNLAGAAPTTATAEVSAAEAVHEAENKAKFVNRAGEKIRPNEPSQMTDNAGGGTPAAEVQKVMSNKEAREAMLTTEELLSAAKPVRIYEKPPVDLLTRSGSAAKVNSSALQAKAMKLEETLKNFHVDARVVQVTQGPTVTRYEVQPAVGVKVSSIVRLSDDIALNLEARSIRIEAPIPGKAAVGIEIENESITMVKLRDIIDSKEFRNAKSKITFAVGKDISGNNIVADLKSMPHLLIAGSTGSGKSVCINSIILSLLYKANPDEVKLILVDPKVVELGNYNGIPHLLIPVVTDPSKAAAALNWAVAEMTDRYKKFAENGVRDLESYNEAVRADGEQDKVMPQVVIIIDELADLMMTAPSQIEESIGRLAQMARAAGMHLIIATQRPSVDVITGTIKSNIGSRIAFAVSSQIDSRTILDMQGAEKLVGKGDMLFNPMGMGKPIRVQGTYVSDGEVNDVIQFVKGQVESDGNQYNADILTCIERSNSADAAEEADELLLEAIDLVVHSGQASVSMLQRRFRIGYNRAARIVDMMEARGIIGPQDGSRPRQVLMTEAELEAMEQETAGI